MKLKDGQTYKISQITWRCKWCGTLNHNGRRKCRDCKVQKSLPPNAEAKQSGGQDGRAQ